MHTYSIVWQLKLGDQEYRILEDPSHVATRTFAEEIKTIKIASNFITHTVNLTVASRYTRQPHEMHHEPRMTHRAGPGASR